MKLLKSVKEWFITRMGVSNNDKIKIPQFNILSLPSLARDHILRIMDFQEIMMLSFCSKKTVETLGISRALGCPNKIFIKLSECFSEILLYSETKNVFYGWHFSQLGEWRRGWKYPIDNKMWTIKGGKYLIDTTLEPSRPRNYIYSEGPHDEKSINSMFSHFVTCFPKCQVEDICVVVTHAEEHFQVRNILTPISEVNKLTIGVLKSNEDLLWILKNMRISKMFRLELLKDKLQNQQIKKLDCSDLIMSTDSGWAHGDVLLNLNCIESIFHNSLFTSEDIMGFLRQWKRSEGVEMRRIRILKIELNVLLDLDLVELGATPWDAIERSISWFPGINFDEGWDIRRADGLVGTMVMLERFWFGFFVFDN